MTTSYEACPVCEGKIKSDQHPAVIDDWMWAKRLAPGVLIYIVGMIMDFHPIALATGVVVLLIGFATLLHYMVAERWRRPYYVKFDPDIP